jgi:hypothetical protein
MIRQILLICLAWISPPSPSSPPVKLDVRVVTYSTGKNNTDAYEGLSFWVKNNQRAYIRYVHGKDDAEEIELTWNGLTQLNGEKVFGMQFPDPDKRYWFISCKGATLKVTDRSGNYPRVFSWENETLSGKNENASGEPTTTCSFCAQNEQEAMEIMQKYFFR